MNKYQKVSMKIAKEFDNKNILTTYTKSNARKIMKKTKKYGWDIKDLYDFKDLVTSKRR